MSDYLIYADSAGTLANQKETVLVLASVIVSDAQLKRIEQDFIELTNKVSKLGINIEDPKFEFHAYHLLQSAGRWRKIEYANRFNIARDIKKIIRIHHLPYVVVIVDKADSGMQEVGDLHELIKSSRNKELDNLGEHDKKLLDLAIPPGLVRKGLGKLGELTAVLFGLTVGLMDQLGMKGEAQIIADKQFLKQIDSWNLIHFYMNIGWDKVVAQLDLTTGRHPRNIKDWPIRKPLQEIESHKSYGVQLADFIAYTAKRRWLNIENDMANRVALAGNRNMKRLKPYKGIYIGIPILAMGRKALSGSELHYLRHIYGSHL